jgi:AcrR family transcriptional regulator
MPTPKSSNEIGQAAVKRARTEWRTRQVLDAASSLMSEIGFHAMSVQALAERAEISVGLIYQYFGSKEDILQAVIVDILDAYGDDVPEAIAGAGDDPVAQLAAGFDAYCKVVDSHHKATVLAYRESGTLTEEGRAQVKEMELGTMEPLLDVVRRAQETGTFLPMSAELIAHDLLLLAHGWALKYWFFAPRYSLDEYVSHQLAVILRTLLPASSWKNYPDHLPTE